MPAAFPRWIAVAALLAVFGTLPVVRAQPATGTYGVELRGTGAGSRVEARVGPNTSQAETASHRAGRSEVASAVHRGVVGARSERDH